MIELSDREKFIITATASISLIAGVWLGVWSLPVEALDVPTNTNFNGDGTTRVTAAYQPVPTWLPFVSIALPIGIIYFAYRSWLLDYQEEFRDKNEAVEELRDYQESVNDELTEDTETAQEVTADD